MNSKLEVTTKHFRITQRNSSFIKASTSELIGNNKKLRATIHSAKSREK